MRTNDAGVQLITGRLHKGNGVLLLFVVNMKMTRANQNTKKAGFSSDGVYSLFISKRAPV